MNDVEHLLHRQAQWQKSRQSLAWPEKIRLVERLHESLRQWRAKPMGVASRSADPWRNRTKTT